MSHALDRRRVILAGSALCREHRSARRSDRQAGLAPAADLLAATRRFLGSLEPEQRKAASFAWDGPEWRSWNYFGVAGYIKPGLRLEQMNAIQKAAAWNLLEALFSPAGLEKTRNVMLLAGRARGERQRRRPTLLASGSPLRSTARRPRPARGASGSKGITYPIDRVRDNRIVSVTPSSFSALPTASRPASMPAWSR